MPLPLADVLTDVSIREGSQQPSDLRSASVADKVEVFRHLQTLGVRTVEAVGFAPGPWFHDAEPLADAIAAEAEPTTRLLGIYFNRAGLERLLAHPRWTPRGLYFTAATPTYRSENYNQRSVDHALERQDRMLEAFHALGVAYDLLTLSTAWGDAATPVGADEAVALLAPFLERAQAAGRPVQEVALADTVGQATPESLAALVGVVRRTWPDLRLTIHLHAPQDQAFDRVEAVLDTTGGDLHWDAALGGLGGSPNAHDPGGNLDLRWLVRAYARRGWPIGLNLEALPAALAALQQRVTRPLPSISVF